MAVSSELSSLLNALDDPAMLIRPEDMSVAAVNSAFQRVFGAFRFEGRRCWEALHRPDACSRCGLGCPASALTRTRSEVHVEQTLFAGAGLVRFRVSMRPVLAADGNIVYWLERIRHERGIAAGEFTRGQVGVSAAHQTLMREILKAAAADHPLILVGERGLGKELYARTVHENSVRASRPFVVVDAAAVTDKNAAALFFGCVRTRGRAERRGLMERAAGGTLFIKNIDLLPRAAQALLERVLETGSFEPAGADVPTAAVFRLMASAHKKPADLLAEGRLEAGLAALLAHRVLAVAPLRDRREDIAPLARHFVRMLAPANTYTITERALEALSVRRWPGNARELREVLEAAAMHAQSTTIAVDDLVPEIGEGPALFHDEAALVPLKSLESRYLLWAQASFDGSRAELARVLGVSERTLYRLLARAEQECGQKEKDSQALQVLPERKEPASAGEANGRGEDA